MRKLYTFGCRVFQGIIKIGNYALGYRTPETLEGEGACRQVGQYLKQKNIATVLVVTGASMVKRGAADDLLQGLEEAGIRVTMRTYDRPDPTDADVEQGLQDYYANNCRAIIALGGGSRIDCAKAIAARVARPGKKIAQLQGLMQVMKKTPLLIAIPTTAGAGSETTVAAVITDTASGRKASINDVSLIPSLAVLDARLTVTLPPKTTATTGMDALTHAVECYVNHTYLTKLEKNLAREAAQLIHGNLRTAVTDGSNLTARQNMQRAAFAAGRAFTRGCVGYVHALGHTLGALYHVEHGLAMSVLLPVVMERFGASAYKRLAELAEVCGLPGETDGEKAGAFLAWIRETNRELGIPEKLDCIKEADFPQIIRWVKKEAHPLYPTPQVWQDEDFIAVLKAVMA